MKVKHIYVKNAVNDGGDGKEETVLFDDPKAGNYTGWDYIEVGTSAGRVHVYPDGNVLLFKDGEEEGKYLHRVVD